MSNDKKTSPDATDTPRSRRHLIHPLWLRITLKSLMWLVIALLLIPVALYVPPVQTFVKDTACSIVRRQTGIDISISRFRLKWPVDIELQGVSVVEASGDTMARVGSAVADVKLLPLLRLDAVVKKLTLSDGFYRMVSPDSSMILSVRAHRVEVGAGSAADLADMKISLRGALLEDADVSLLMDVWKQKPTPRDTAPVPFSIEADRLSARNLAFRMSMLPLIDTLTLVADRLDLEKGVVDLGKNLVTARLLKASGGDVTYLTPTPEYVKEHPAPVAVPDPDPAPPMVIKADSVALAGFNVLYAVKDTRPLEGFDPSYISLSEVNVALSRFYNEASAVRLPVTLLSAKERSGLQITSGSGLVAVDSAGLSLKNLNVSTPWSEINATAAIPFALMELNPRAPLNVDASGSLGMPDIDAFLPLAKDYTRFIPGRVPLKFNLRTEGTLGKAEVPALSLSLPGVLSLEASGSADNPLDLRKTDATLRFKGSLVNPAFANSLLGKDAGFSVPDFVLSGEARAQAGNYGADFSVRSSAGELAAKGQVGINAETYRAQARVSNVDVARFMPRLGVGNVNATLRAAGGGFDPTLPHADTEIGLDVVSVEYNRQLLRNITARATLHDGVYDISLLSHNNPADFNLAGTGTVAPDRYTFDLRGNLRKLDLMALGLSPEPNEGRGRLAVNGSASPSKWLYDINLKLDSLEWTVGNQFVALPGHVEALFNATPAEVNARVDALRTALAFNAATGLKPLLGAFSVAADSIKAQYDRKNINLGDIQRTLPPFSLAFEAGGTGALGQYLNTMGFHTDTVHARLLNDSIFTASLGALRLGNASMTPDTLTLSLRQRGDLLDYRAHMGNRPDNSLAEFADVNLNGYLGSNRLLMSLTQKNQLGQTGYRLGFTAAFADSTVSLHFTPLKATIGYLPWTFNGDNHIDWSFASRHIDANLMASSNESSIKLLTQRGKDGNDELNIDINNLHIQDFLRLSVFAPPISASVNSNLTVGYNNNWLYGWGTLGIEDFSYDNMRVGNFNFNVGAGLNNAETSGAIISMDIDGRKAMQFTASARPDSATHQMVPQRMDLELTRFPLSVANPFLGSDVASLSGALNGKLNLTGSLEQPVLNGSVACDSVEVFIPMIGSRLSFGQDSITVADNFLRLHDFDILGANRNPAVINGSVDARRLSDIVLDLDMDARNFQLMGNDRRAGSDIYGRLFLDMKASAKGPLQHFSINADVNVLPATDVTYSVPQTTAELTRQNAGDVVTFVNFNDTASLKPDSVQAQTVAMRILASLTLEPGAQVAVDIPGTATTGNGKVELSPSGTLRYFQNFMGDMRLNGQLTLGEGFVRYSVPIVGEKRFTFNPASFVLWNGNLMNPVLSIDATDKVKASLLENGSSRIVNFLVNLQVNGTLDAPKVLFNLSTDDDMTLQNDLLSMSPDQRSTAAINLLLTGQYSAAGARTASSDLVQGALYGVLTSQLNSWMANHVRGVDLSFGVDQFDRSANGQTGTSTSYSYQLSKSLFNNRFKISVGGNYTTDASADENFSENLISDISFEYILKQTANVTMYGRLFRHTGYESILEGEITETGLGFVLKRRLANLRNLFNFGHRREDAQPSHALSPDSTARPPKEPGRRNENDSIPQSTL